MARQNIALKTTPLLDALLIQANDNAKRIRDHQKYHADTAEYWYFISRFCDELKKTYAISPKDLTSIEASHLMIRQAWLLDQVFRRLYGLGPQRNDFKLILRSARLGLKAMQKSRKIRKNMRQIDERNRQNDERNRQILTIKPSTVIASEARQSRISPQLKDSGLPRRYAPRNDGKGALNTVFRRNDDTSMLAPMKTTASSILKIDLEAISQNYETVKSLVLPPCKTTAVVKANAYGLGIEEVAKQLTATGVRSFFVATIDEAIELRKYTDRKIMTLNGFFRGAEKEYLNYNIIPVLCSLDEIDRWTYNRKCFWQVDTGMNRLGLRCDEFEKAFERAHIQPSFIISHLACADEAQHPMNEAQRQKFEAIAQKHPLMRYSLANSSGIYLGAEYHYNMVRPGMALFGLNPTPELANPMKQVVTLETRVLQIHEGLSGQTAGYGASHQFTDRTRLATVSLGYADGFSRQGSNRAKLYWEGVPCPIVGRVSMDLIIVDISKIPVNIIPPYAGDWLEVIGEHQSADTLAKDLGTIGYEVLTSLGSRSHRIYKTASNMQ